MLRLENLPHRERLELIRDVLSRHTDDLEADTLSLLPAPNLVYKNSVHDTAFCYRIFDLSPLSVMHKNQECKECPVLMLKMKLLVCCC